MKERVLTQGEWIILKDDAARGLGLLQLVERRKMTIDNGFIGERPQPFAGLQLRRGGREKQEMDTLWNSDRFASVPACEGPATNTMWSFGPAPTD